MNTRPAGAASSFGSLHSTTFPEMLKECRASVMITTYQAERLIIARADGGVLNTHFRTFNTPMGLAYHRGRLALGSKIYVWEFRDCTQAARKLEPPDRHDACFLPRWQHITGDIAIHEIAYGGEDELWLVNTRFSCLCTLDDDHSFVPRWRPPFITSYAPEDRCHLNGLAMVDGTPRYVTCLGPSDEPSGWRASKADGGCLLDVHSGEVIASGLSMPHSPRWYRDRLWVLESGKGTLATVDRATGKLETVARLPGFTRGLDFLGCYAFVGLSQVRESAVFSGIPIAEEKERTCGVWVVDIETGRTAAFLQFSGSVQEIFAVQVLPGIGFPDLVLDEAVLSHSYILPDEALAEAASSGNRP
jgi:uncharacterized protein (TIGR03032 family)